MLDFIKTALSKRKCSGWQVAETHRISHQSFLAKEERESFRVADTKVFEVTLHQRRDDVLGLSSFKVSPGQESNLEKILDEALFSCERVSNRPFELPEQSTKLPAVEITDKTLNEKTLGDCEERLKAAVHREKNIRLSSAEFFIDHIATRLINHKGLDQEQEETRLSSEFILLSGGNGRENEFINRYSRRFFKDFNLEEEVMMSARQARDATQATLPATGSFPVLISDEPLDQLFKPLLARASGRLKYNRMVHSEVGNSVLPEGEIKGDKMTLWSNSLLPGGLGSFCFDEFGTPANRTLLIENNILKNYLVDKRYADYLGLPVTGSLGNLEVQAGSAPFQSLKDLQKVGGDRMYHLMAFSAFEPNAITGAFSAEIRSGYEISKSGVRPIKGGSVSGILQDALLNCRLSREQVQRERVLVPKGVLFNSLTLAGM